MIWVICLISFALKTFRNQGKWFLRAVGPWRPFLAIEISRWRNPVVNPAPNSKIVFDENTDVYMDSTPYIEIVIDEEETEIDR